MSEIVDWLGEITEREQSHPSQVTHVNQIVRYVIDHYAEMSEQDVAGWERAAGEGPEGHLMYAFRVSKCVATSTNFKTIGRRWETAVYGPQGSSGLNRGRQSMNYEAAYGFLSNLYLTRCHELAIEFAKKTEVAATKLKSPDAKSNKYGKAADKIRDGIMEVGGIEGARDLALKWAQYFYRKGDEA